MIVPGVCSVTFRDKSPEAVVEQVASEGLKAIEWGADVHAPPDDVDNARRVGELTRQAGLEVAGYGSYYLAFDEAGEAPAPFQPVLAAAAAMGAPIIRIWGGSLKVPKTDAYFGTVVQRCREAAGLAAEKNIKVAFEYHRNTFTETLEGTLRLLEAVDHPNIYTFWQPRNGSTLDERLEEIKALADRLLSIHVFHWQPSPKPPFPRLNLNDGADLWKPCLDAIGRLPGDHYALLEFVRDDAVEQFRQDATTLRRMTGAGA